MRLAIPRTRSSIFRLAPAITALIVAGCGAAPSHDEETVATAAQADSAESAFSRASNWVGLLSNWYSFGTTMMPIWQFLAPADAAPESHIEADLVAIWARLGLIDSEIAAASWLSTQTQVKNALAKVASASRDARVDMQTLGYVTAPDLKLAQSSEGMTDFDINEGFFHRVDIDRKSGGFWNDTSLEWQLITRPAPADEFGLAWDYRLALPAYMEGIAMRLNVLATAAPDRFRHGDFRGEIIAYRDKLRDILGKIEGNVVCQIRPGIQEQRVWDVHAICADPFTGISTVLTKKITDPFNPSFFWSSAWLYGGIDSAGGEATLWRHWDLNARSMDPNDWDGTFWFDASNWDDVAASYPACYESQAGCVYPIEAQDFMHNALDDAHAQLRMKLGLFEVRRMVDSLSRMISGDKGPIFDGRVRSGVSDGCLSTNYDAAAFASRLVTTSCHRIDVAGVGSRETMAATWKYDPISGNIVNVASGLCVDVMNGSSRAHQGLWLWGCWPSNDGRSIAQRWSYDPTSKLFRNALGRVLDAETTSAAADASVWMEDENGTTSQKWGYMTVKGHGPFGF